MATSISLYFLLPGAMSLIALLGADIPPLWRTTFALASGIGAILTFMGGLRSARLSGGALVAAGQWLGCALYLLVLVVANVPAITLFGTRIASLLVAGLSLSLLVTLGVLFAWGFFLEQQREPNGGAR